jgi:hypothetical protein
MITRYLEAIAMGLQLELAKKSKAKKADNQSTATAGYNGLNSTLYVTHQSNATFDGIMREYERRVTYKQGKSKKKGVGKGGDNRERVVVETPVAFETNVYGGRKHMTTHVDLDEWLRGCSEHLEDDQNEDGFSEFIDQIAAVKVVLNKDLFVTSGTVTSGFHGESRIIRYHFLKTLRKFSWERLKELENASTSSDLIQEVEEDFTNRIGSHLRMGSSQGACSYCAAYMKRLGIRYSKLQGLNKNRDSEWVHPVTMTPKSTSSGVQYAFPTTRMLRVDRAAKTQKGWKEEDDEESMEAS